MQGKKIRLQHSHPLLRGSAVNTQFGTFAIDSEGILEAPEHVAHEMVAAYNDFSYADPAMDDPAIRAKPLAKVVPVATMAPVAKPAIPHVTPPVVKAPLVSPPVQPVPSERLRHTAPVVVAHDDDDDESSNILHQVAAHHDDVNALQASLERDTAVKPDKGHFTTPKRGGRKGKGKN